MRSGSSRAFACAALLVAAGAAPAADRPPQGLPRAPEFVQKVNAAIDDGVGWLKKAQKPDGSYADFPTYEGATAALAYHTLRVCGVPATDASARRAYDAARRAYAPANLKTYSAALYLMAIAEHGERRKDAGDEHDVRLDAADRKWAYEIVQALASGQDELGRWGYDVGPPTTYGGDPQFPVRRSGYFDNSNTQYALLGLKAATRCDIEVKPELWLKSLAHFVKTQEPSGPEVARHAPGPVRPEAERGKTSSRVLDHARGWTYGPDDRRPSAYSPMTAGGISSLVICRSELLRTGKLPATDDVASERAIRDGLAWLGTRWQPRDPVRQGGPGVPPDERAFFPRVPGWSFDLYEYYGVERAGVLAGVDWMADLDWYGAGTEILVKTQEPDGAWRGIRTGIVPGGVDADQLALSRDVVDVCFALLFLKRGTTPVRLGGVATTGAPADDIDFAAAARLEGRDFEDFIDLVLQRWTRATDDAVRARIFDGAAALALRLVEPLLVRMDAPEGTRRTAAHALLRRITGLDFGYDPAAAPAAREPAVTAWQGWWLTNRSRLVFDAASGRLVRR